ncbi:mechanosensitive ion channel family protein [Algoriphagus sp.]|jgi:small-conductance mechanosensitive channel|uniref:mechanosensitive ion channel family protein n=1 Tax=Algoriphagus sp. TaxID=1872435 RepID=UPI0027186CE9|nr:mechanosensitive ion channel domain-containing protein [Algoriphagus sp.]MDO8966212.1 mechanosensitive ion channel [Algoriphagus sp.]MDP3198650.1 mechanosensitive ion channel [Algoriphagus sp.]
MEKKGSFLEWLENILNENLISLGDSKLTIGLAMTLVLSFVALFVIAEWVRRFLVKHALKKTQIAKGTKESIGTMVKYLIILGGIFSILQTNGIDLSAFGVLAGAIGVGIGFGLQNITNNFISGLIILFEQPIKVGDRIEVGDVSGDVIQINARATTVVTNDNISVIVPNSQFIDSQVINWSHNEHRIRFNFPVGVSYKEDPEKIKKILVEVAKAIPGILETPEADVLFDSYGDNSLNFNLRVWTSDYVNKPNVLKSQLYYAIFKRFTAENVEIPFPQRDLHLKSGFEKLGI